MPTRKPITVPSGVKVNIEGRTVTVTGPKGTLSRDLPGAIAVTPQGETLVVTRPSDSKTDKALHGLCRTLVANMVETGKSPLLTPAELADLGFRFVISPLSVLFAMVKAATGAIDTLKAEGSLRNHLPTLIDFASFGQLVDLDAHYGAEAHSLQHVARLGPRVGGIGMAQQGADRGIVEHRHRFEGERHLEGARQSQRGACLRREARDVPAGEGHGSGRHRQVAGQAVEEGRLAGSVGADQAEDVALLDRHRDVIDRLEAAEGLGDVAGVDQAHLRRSSSDSRPLGRKRAMITMMAP